jgi:lysophospholipase L1-like esterase
MRSSICRSAAVIALSVIAGVGCSGGADGSDDATQFGGAAGALSAAGAHAVAGGASGAGALGGASDGGAQSGGQPGLGGAPSGGTGGAPSGGTGGAPSGGTSGAPPSAGAGGSAGGSGGVSGSVGSAGANATAGSGGAAGAANLPAVSVYLAGDSTVSQYVLDPKDPKSWAGWGQMLGAYYSTSVTVVDAAVGGRTARRFIQEKSLDGILSKIKAGDYLFVQFGTNDSNTTATYVLDGVTYPYYAAADTDFKTYLQQYIDGALGKKAIPVLVTPPPRNSAYCKGGRSLANYGQAMLDLGKADAVAVVDLGLKTYTYLNPICPKPTTAAAEMFFKINPDMTIDGTHFQENGARIMAGFVADGVGEDKLALAAYRKP